MYFPYLYARQGECRAIEDVASLLGPATQKVVPILEPVVANGRDLKRALDSLKAHNRFAYLITNPSKHKLDRTATVTPWLAEMAGHLADVQLLRPTLEIRSNTGLPDVKAFLKQYANREVGLSIRSSHLPGTDIAAETGGHSVLHFLHGSADPVGYSATIGASRSVEVRDSFRAEARNADYKGTEQFTAAHLHYAKDSRPGFSDYTLLPGTFNASGGPLGAAVIHLSYVDPHDKSVWVEHFVSDETRQYEGSQPSKLLEAMTKLDAEIAAKPAKFIGTPGLASYQAQFRARTPTNPTYNKRQQVSHHIVTASTVV